MKMLKVFSLGFLAIYFCSGIARAQLPEPVPCEGCWIPSLVTSWQWQLQGKVDPRVQAQMYDIDLFENSPELIQELHETGRRVVCYMSAGTWENWRPDKELFPEEVIGKRYKAWKGERWLDIRRLDLLAEPIRARLDLCKEKGFDGVEFDNIDGYLHDTGFPISYRDQLLYNIFLANEAHLRGLNAGYKNNPEQVQELLPYFDWVLVEQCVQFDECEIYLPFVQSGKPVMAVEYKGTTSKICSVLNSLNFNGLKKKKSLKAWGVSCR
ncbi:MAG: endo alpha-1,4 polygalactosaminidase [bacterium]